MTQPLLIIFVLLFAVGWYMMRRIEISYRAFTALGRPTCLPSLAVMSWSPCHQLRWSARAWSRWAEGRLVLLDA